MMKKSLGYLKVFFKFSFAFFIIGYMVYSGRLDFAVVKKGFTQGATIFGAMSLLSLSACIAFYRWMLLSQGQGMAFSFSQAVRYGLIGCFFNTTMPGAVSGDIIKAWYVIADHKGFQKTPVLTAIFLDRVMGVFGLVIVSSAALFFSWNSVWSSPQLHKIAIFVLLMAAGVFVFFCYMMISMWGPFAYLRKKMEILQNYKVGRAFLKGYDAWMHYRNCPGILLQALTLSVLTHLSVVTTVIFCAHALEGAKVAFYQYFLLVPLGLLTTAIPVAPAGLGVGHVAFGQLFAAAGSTQGAEIFTLFVTFQIIINLSGVFFYLKSDRVKVPQEAME